MIPFPIVRLELQGMQMSILTALNTHADHLKDEIEAEVKRVVAEFDFRREVEQLTKQCIREAGKKAIEEALYKGFRSPEVVSLLDLEVRSAFAKLLKDMRRE